MLYYTLTELNANYREYNPDTEKDRGEERQTKTQNTRRTYIHTISDNIAEHRYKQSEKKRDRNTDQETYIYNKNE